MCMSQNMTISNVSLLDSGWNDEIMYFKQVEGIKEFGIPQGYFGYNEQHVERLTLAVWSPFCYVIYTLWSKLFGWNYMSPIWCNLFMLSIAFGCFTWIVRPNSRQTAVVAGLYLLFTPITRYALLGMIESNVLFLVILFTALWLKAMEPAK